MAETGEYTPVESRTVHGVWLRTGDFQALEARAQAATGPYEALRFVQTEAGEMIESLLRQLTVRGVPLERTTARYDFMQEAIREAIADYERKVKG